MTTMRAEVGSSYALPVPNEVFLKRTLSAVKRRRGLIHGQYDKAGAVCALGALGAVLDRENADMCVNSKLAQELQEVNDSVPKATSAKRRQVVIRWLEKQLKAATGKSKP